MNNLSEKFNRELIEIQTKIKALETFDDLEEIKDRWGQNRLVSANTNFLVSNFEVKKECDCCRGVKVYALPYVEFDGLRIYCKPYFIPFARFYDDKYYSIDDWESEFDEDFSEELLELIEKWLDVNED